MEDESFQVAKNQSLKLGLDPRSLWGGKSPNNFTQNIVFLLAIMKTFKNKVFSNFKNISTLTTIDIPNQPNSIGGKDLKNKLNSFKNVQYKEDIIDAIKSISVKKNDVILITGSLYLAGEILNLN